MNRSMVNRLAVSALSLAVIVSSASPGLIAASNDFQNFVQRQLRRSPEFSQAPADVAAPYVKYRTNRYNGWWTPKMLDDYRIVKAMRAAEHGALFACTELLMQSGDAV